MRVISRITLVTTCALLLAASAQAQTADASGQVKAQAQVQSTTPAGDANAQASVDAQAKAKADAEATRQSMEQKASKTSKQAKAQADAKLQETSQKVDESAEKGEDKVCRRLASEFGVSAEVLAKEKSDLACSWGELMIAHDLSANLKTPIEASQLLRWHQDGMGWGQMAAGLGLSLGSVVSSANTESRVAAGSARADGKVAGIYGEGARGAGAGLDMGVGAQAGKVAAGGTAGLGVKIGH
jgi:hypothetical protein